MFGTDESNENERNKHETDAHAPHRPAAATMNLIRQALSKIISYVRPVSTTHISITVAAFAASCLLGFYFAPELGRSDWWGQKVRVLNFRDKPYVKKSLTLSEQHHKFIEYALHNSRVFAIMVIAGTICFLLPVFQISVLGFIFGVAFWNLGSPWLYPRLFLPHGLIELPLRVYVNALVMGSGWKWLFSGSGKRWRTLKEELMANLRVMPVILSLIVLAALLEAYVTSRW